MFPFLPPQSGVRNENELILVNDSPRDLDFTAVLAANITVLYALLSHGISLNLYSAK
jgi:hypothetical protein